MVVAPDFNPGPPPARLPKWDAPDLDAELGAVTWDDLVLPPDLLAGLRDAVEGFAVRREAFAALGFPWRRGILLIGPPGTGKTMACKAAAAALSDRPFLYVRDFRSGHGGDALQIIFARPPAGSLHPRLRGH